MIKTIILDLGNVIVPLNFPAVYRAMAPRCGMKAEQITERLSASGLVVQLEAGQIEPLPFFEKVTALLGLDISYDEFCQAWNSIFVKDTFIPEEMLVRLRERYRLVLLSNTNAIHIPYLREQYPLLRHFHQQVLSHEVGAMKPHARIYEAALAASECASQECFFTDDILPYVEGARSHGIQAEQFLGLEKLHADLHSRGVEY
jgi:glucose-1-phosphatase